ncbi:hypothetical protein TSAR_009462 [Trichomalopsis sarcophagae]|uniref:Uncharacterized protein n=1 Tax=Trichomalopsis sarcophagae TaxID=543379 RepID=A0A232FM38_9HYME|nr:hypothetical protein TSAR_009462 [Trichomalopsis sarcophagae]
MEVAKVNDNAQSLVEQLSDSANITALSQSVKTSSKTQSVQSKSVIESSQSIKTVTSSSMRSHKSVEVEEEIEYEE